MNQQKEMMQQKVIGSPGLATAPAPLINVEFSTIFDLALEANNLASRLDSRLSEIQGVLLGAEPCKESGATPQRFSGLYGEVEWRLNDISNILSRALERLNRF